MNDKVTFKLLKHRLHKTPPGRHLLSHLVMHRFVIVRGHKGSERKGASGANVPILAIIRYLISTYSFKSCMHFSFCNQIYSYYKLTFSAHFLCNSKHDGSLCQLKLNRYSCALFDYVYIIQTSK
jgi:hypothetical protein